MVVHCSAGVGRTGTFITLYKLYKDLQDPKVGAWCTLKPPAPALAPTPAAAPAPAGGQPGHPAHSRSPEEAEMSDGPETATVCLHSGLF